MNKSLLKPYKCHKTVHAAKIARAHVIRDLPVDQVELTFEDENIPAHLYSLAWCQSKGVTAGGYLVQHEDGTESFWPALPFEQGHTLIDPKQAGEVTNV